MYTRRRDKEDAKVLLRSYSTELGPATHFEARAHRKGHPKFAAAQHGELFQAFRGLVEDFEHCVASHVRFWASDRRDWHDTLPKDRRSPIWHAAARLVGFMQALSTTHVLQAEGKQVDKILDDRRTEVYRDIEFIRHKQKDIDAIWQMYASRYRSRRKADIDALYGYPSVRVDERKRDKRHSHNSRKSAQQSEHRPGNRSSLPSYIRTEDWVQGNGQHAGVHAGTSRSHGTVYRRAPLHDRDTQASRLSSRHRAKSDYRHLRRHDGRQSPPHQYTEKTRELSVVIGGGHHVARLFQGAGNLFRGRHVTVPSSP